jgi:hypothetical protein
MQIANDHVITNMVASVIVTHANTIATLRLWQRAVL